MAVEALVVIGWRPGGVSVHGVPSCERKERKHEAVSDRRTKCRVYSCFCLYCEMVDQTLNFPSANNNLY